MNNFSLYGIRLTIITISLFVITILFCYTVDPFSAYGRIYLQNGAEVNSPGFSYQLRMGKAIAIKRIKPTALIMGSSRSAWGLSPEIANKHFTNKKVYNSAYPAVTMYEILRYFQHTVASAPLKHAYIGLDFYGFHGGRPLASTFREKRLAVDINNQATLFGVSDFSTTLFSGDAVYYAIKVATGLFNKGDLYLTNGFKQLDQPSGGKYAFVSSEKQYINGTYTAPAFTFSTPNKNSSTTFDYFRKVVQLAHEKNIDLHFFISPSHARQWEVIDQLDLWSKWEYWKHEMLHITEQEGSHYKQNPIPIHDFSGYSSYSTESVPRKDGETVQWYSDSSHYKHNLGNILMAEMLQGSGENSFGRILNPKNIKQHLDSINHDKKQYQLSHPQDVLDIQHLVEKRRK